MTNKYFLVLLAIFLIVALVFCTILDYDPFSGDYESISSFITNGLGGISTLICIIFLVIFGVFSAIVVICAVYCFFFGDFLGKDDNDDENYNDSIY